MWSLLHYWWSPEEAEAKSWCWAGPREPERPKEGGERGALRSPGPVQVTLRPSTGTSSQGRPLPSACCSRFPLTWQGSPDRLWAGPLSASPRGSPPWDRCPGWGKAWGCGYGLPAPSAQTARPEQRACGRRSPAVVLAPSALLAAVHSSGHSGCSGLAFSAPSPRPDLPVRGEFL